MPQTRQPAEKRKEYVKKRTLTKPMVGTEILKPFTTMKRRKRVVLGDDYMAKKKAKR